MHSLSLIRVLLGFFVCMLSSVDFSVGISCKNEDNQDVDWFLVYKIPKDGSATDGSNLKKGSAYAYITSDGPEKWTLSSKGINEQTSILARTWHDFDSKKKNSDTAYLFYNDNGLDNYNNDAVGPVKGYFAFDTKTGFWLVHSIPEFGESEKYIFPNSGYDLGQTAICITTSTESLNEICKHLLYCQPNINEKSIAASILQTLDDDDKTLFSDNPTFVQEAPFDRESTLKSSGNVVFNIYAKNYRAEMDLYGEILTNSLDTSLGIESHRVNEPALCDPRELNLNDVQEISFEAIGSPDPISFPSERDFSKWAIAVPGNDVKWVCITDFDNIDIEYTKGNGAICFQSEGVWKTYRSSIALFQDCPAEGG